MIINTAIYGHYHISNCYTSHSCMNITSNYIFIIIYYYYFSHPKFIITQYLLMHCYYMPFLYTITSDSI